MVVKKVSRRKKTVAAQKKKTSPRKRTDSTQKKIISKKKAVSKTKVAPQKKTQPPLTPPSTDPLSKRIKLIIPPGRILTAEGWNHRN